MVHGILKALMVINSVVHITPSPRANGNTFFATTSDVEYTSMADCREQAVKIYRSEPGTIEELESGKIEKYVTDIECYEISDMAQLKSVDGDHHHNDGVGAWVGWGHEVN